MKKSRSLGVIFFFFQRARFNICWILKLSNFIFLIRNEIINFHHISSKPILCIFRTTYGHMNDWMKVSRNGVPVTMSDNNWHNLKQVSLIRIIGDIRVPFTSNCYTYLFFYTGHFFVRAIPITDLVDIQMWPY